MDWKSYHHLDVIYDFIDKLASDYPNVCSTSSIGSSVENRDIKMLKISNNNETNVGVWLDGSIHPREWISTSAVLYIANYIVNNYHLLPKHLSNIDWYIVPVVNPDGYVYTHKHDRMWRKNRAKFGECVGVDLNRNFSFGWGEKGEEGSSEDPGSIFYRGPEPFSQPETQAVRDTVLNSNVDFKAFISLHSFGEVVIFPWGHTAEPCPDYVKLLEGGTVMSKAFYESTGNIYRVGSTKDLMYYASGNSIDWAYGAANIPFCFMMELGASKHRFLLPKEEIMPTCKGTLNAILSLMEFMNLPT